VELLEVIVGHGKARGRIQPVVGIERWRVTPCAAFALEYVPAPNGQSVELVGIGRRLERVNVKRECVELLVAVTSLSPLCKEPSGQLPDIARYCGNEVAVPRQHVHPLIECGVTHQVADAPMPHESAGVQVTPLFDPDQIGELRRRERARTLTGENASRNREVDSFDLGRRELFEPSIRVWPQPGGRERFALSLSDISLELLSVIGLRGFLSQPQVGHVLYGAVTLRAADHGSVWHQAGVAFPARRLADLDVPPLPNDVVRKRADAPAAGQA